MPDPTTKTAAEAVAKGALAQLRHIAAKSNDKELARSIFCELGDLKHRIAVKHSFPKDCKEKV